MMSNPKVGIKNAPIFFWLFSLTLLFIQAGPALAANQYRTGLYVLPWYAATRFRTAGRGDRCVSRVITRRTCRHRQPRIIA